MRFREDVRSEQDQSSIDLAIQNMGLHHTQVKGIEEYLNKMSLQLRNEYGYSLDDFFNVVGIATPNDVFDAFTRKTDPVTYVDDIMFDDYRNNRQREGAIVMLSKSYPSKNPGSGAPF
jgi:hypothetical protein